MGKGGGGAPTQVSNLTIPEYAQPYMEKLLGQTEALTETPLTSYTGERVAGPTVAQREVRQAVQGMQLPSGLQTSQQLAGQAGLEALARSIYSPGSFTSTNVQPVQLEQHGMQAAQTGFRPDIESFQMTTPKEREAILYQAAQTGFKPDLQFYQVGAPAERGTPLMQAAQTGFRPDLQGAGEFTGETAQRYMSPYMQQVVEVQKQRAIEDAKKTQLAQNLGAARQGTYGGARQLLATTEREKALGEQLGQIQATGTQAAYEQAAQQFERDRTARLQVQALETDVGLKTALANLDANQQAMVQNQAAQLQMQGLNADQALRIALANQQAALGVQTLGTETGLRTSLANLDAESQARVQNQASALQTQGLNADTALRIALANQQAALSAQQLGTETSLRASLANLDAEQQARVQNLAAQLQTQGLGAEQALQAALANQQGGLETQKLAEQSRQFAGQLGLEGIQLATGAAGTLGDVASREAQTEMAMRQMQSDIAGQAQREEQGRLDAAYAQFAQEQQDPYMRLGFMSDILRGTSALQGGRAIYEAPQSAAQQFLGAGLPAYAMYRGLQG
jgi:hypothetical protein